MSELKLAIETLVEARRKELGLSKAELLHRVGYRKLHKGFRRLELVYRGEFEGAGNFIARLPQAIEVPVNEVNAAIIHSEKTLADPDWPRRDAEEKQAALAEHQAALARYAEIVAGTSISIPFAMASIIGIVRQTELGIILRRRSFVQGLSVAAVAAAFPAAVAAANSNLVLRSRSLKIGSPEYEAGFRAYMRSKYTTPPTSMGDSMGRAHNSRKEFNKIHRDILVPADPGPGFAHGNFKW